MTYQSQKVAYPFFLFAILLFGLQVLFGIILIVKYIWPDPLLDILPFNTARAIHTNLLVLWMLLGFMGGTYFIIPEEAQTELYSSKIAYGQLVLLVITGVTAVIGFIFGWTEGRPLLEIPRPLDWLIVVGALLFLFNIAMTMFKTKKWTAIQGILLGGLVMLAVVYLFGMYFFKNISVDYYFWWWVVHLWVEGAWELITGAIMAFVLMKLTGVDRYVVEKWLYIEMFLVLATGIIGTGHHYYWIGTPRYWLWWGGIFSALQPIPIILMVFDTLHHVKKRKLEITNRLALYWAVGCAIFHFIGAGVWGFAITLPQVNRWMHGTQLTSSHGHLAFFGAYAMLNLMMIYFALPMLRGVNQYQQTRGFWAFWIMVCSMFGMGLAFGAAGIIQTYVQRILGYDYLTTQSLMRLWYMVVFCCGLIFAGGVVMFIYDFFKLGKEPVKSVGGVT
ncbi:MAG: cbb3-type cytochrome c oxidase subunit I [bacterium]|nr:cbb3-type cytochrome c oxidase subunit I [bacterium]